MPVTSVINDPSRQINRSKFGLSPPPIGAKRHDKKTWGLIQTAYVQGVTATELSEKYGIPIGTIQGRAKRHGWAKLRVAMQEAGPKAVKQSVEGALSKDADKWVNRLKTVYERQVAHLESKQRAGNITLKELKMLAEITELTDKGGRRALGLDKQESTTVNNFIVVTAGDLCKQAQVVQSQQPAPDSKNHTAPTIIDVDTSD